MQARREAQARQRAAPRYGAATNQMKINAVLIAALLSVSSITAAQSAHNPAYQAYQILHWGFVIAPIIVVRQK